MKIRKVSPEGFWDNSVQNFNGKFKKTKIHQLISYFNSIVCRSGDSGGHNLVFRIHMSRFIRTLNVYSTFLMQNNLSPVYEEKGFNLLFDINVI